MAKKNSAKNSTTQLADDVLFGARVLYRELDDIFGHVSGRLPRAAKREGSLFTRMRIAPKPLDLLRQGAVLFLACTYVVVNLFVNVLYSKLTPPLEAGTIKWGFQRGRASPLQNFNRRRCSIPAREVASFNEEQR
jgi:hypothetical protein